MTIKHFSKNISNIDELKKEYRTLSKKFHPDNQNGNIEIMKQINNEYDYLIKNQIFFKSEKEKEKEINFSKTMQDILNKITRLEDIEIEVVGTWIWISGNTYNVKEILKEYGFRWSKGKKKWYFTEQEFDKKRYKQKDYETLKNIYGYVKLNTQGNPQLA